MSFSGVGPLWLEVHGCFVTLLMGTETGACVFVQVSDVVAT